MQRLLSRSLVLLSVTAALLLLALSGCSLADRLQRAVDGMPSAVPSELRTVWEAWTVLSEDHVDKDELVQSKLSAGAIQGMLEALGNPNPDFLSPDQYQLDAPELGAVWQFWNILIKEYGGVDKLDAEVLSQGAIRGMLEAVGNRYTTYLSPAGYSVQRDDYSSSFEGIGARVLMVDGRLTIVSFISDAPAEQSGLSSGDVVLAVDGVSLEGFDLAEAVLRVRGPRGSAVDLLVLRPDQEQPKTVTVIRGLIQPPSVVWEPLPEGVAYLRIEEFVAETGDEVTEALQEINSQEHQGLILDLRFNPGGLVDSTVDVASQFLSGGLVLYQVDAKGNRTDSKVHGGGIAMDVPIVVLVNGASASGAEVLAGALQDHDRAILVGSPTFGKGSVNILKKLSGGSAIDLTYALWYTPNGKLIEGLGLVPDIIVPMDLRILPGSSLDVQLFIAREALKNQITALVG